MKKTENFKLIGSAPNIEFYYYVGNCHIGGMAWAKKLVSNNRYNKAGKIIADKSIEDSLKESEYELLNNWRAIHAFPLQQVTETIRKIYTTIGIEANLVQRTKRLDSIIPKLEKYGLTQIQDIAGCRIIVETIQEIDFLVKEIKTLVYPYELFGEDDYILTPKSSGYRGFHLVYKYKERQPSQYDGLKIEIQFRTKLQHAWATSVEIVDLFTHQSLKSSKGDKDWERFFCLVSNYISMVESSPAITNTSPLFDDIYYELYNLEKKLQVRSLLLSIEKSLSVPIDTGVGDKDYYLIEILPKTILQPHPHHTRVSIFPADSYEIAVDLYLKAERELLKLGGNAVLVSANSIKSVREAYPNYFSDVSLFAMLLSWATQR